MNTKKVVISVLGFDRPGIVAAVTRALLENRCNIEDVNQTIMQTEFAGVFIATVPAEIEDKSLLDGLCATLQPLGLTVVVKPLSGATDWTAPESEPFVVTTVGPDRMGLVAGMTEVLARFGVNIANLKAVFRGGENPRDNLMIYEVDVPVTVEMRAFREALKERAGSLDLELNLQHRDVFEALHRI